MHHAFDAGFVGSLAQRRVVGVAAEARAHRSMAARSRHGLFAISSDVFVAGIVKEFVFRRICRLFQVCGAAEWDAMRGEPIDIGAVAIAISPERARLDRGFQLDFAIFVHFLLAVGYSGLFLITSVASIEYAAAIRGRSASTKAIDRQHGRAVCAR